MDERQPKITGLILAGGLAKRFGGGKCSAILADFPLITWVYSTLSEISQAIWLSVRTQEFQIPEDLAFERIFIDERPGAGPVVALARILQQTKGTLIVAPCDQPFLRKSLLYFLLHEAQRENAEVAVCTDEKGRLLPFPGIFRGPLKLVGTSFKEALAQKHTLIIAPPSWRKYDPLGVSFFNVNYREDLYRAQKLMEAARIARPPYPPQPSS